MTQVMMNIEEIGREDKFWGPYIQWDGKNVTKLWSTIWCNLDPYLCTKTKRDKNSSTTYHQIRQGQISWEHATTKCTQKGCSKIIKYARKKGEVEYITHHNTIKTLLHSYSC